MFKVIETFSGIGSQAKALERIGEPFEIVHTAEWDIFSTMAYCLIHKGKIDTDKYQNISNDEIENYLKSMSLSADGKSLISSRFLKMISIEAKRNIYAAFRETKNLGSVVDITSEDIPEDTDLLTYSFPCQDLSLCGFWHGNFSGIDRDSGNRSSLLWEIERILFDIKNSGRQLPKFLVMENVKAILSDRHAKNFQEWKDELNELGYINKIYCLNASNYGIPQSRERAYMISVYCGKDKILKEKLQKYFDEHNLENEYMYPHRNLTLRDILRTDYSDDRYFKEAISVIPNDTPSRRKIYDDNSHLNSNSDIIVKTLTTKQDRNPNSGVIDFPNNISGKSNFRYLTPRECFLLMGFDEKDFDIVIRNNMNITPHKKRIAFTNEKLTKMAGNSIVVDVLEQIFRQIMDIDKLFFK